MSLEGLLERARAHPRHIVLAEGTDPRTVAAAVRAVRSGLAHITLLGEREAVRGQLAAHDGLDAPVRIIDPTQAERLPAYAHAYQELRTQKKLSTELATRLMAQPLNFAAMMVRMADADGSLAGAVSTSAATMRASVHIIGAAEDTELISSFFIMISGPDSPAGPAIRLFADCALNALPDARQLAEIAVSSARSARQLLGLDPKVAMLSFSTLGSARHPEVQLVREATGLARNMAPELCICGEIQLDAAIDPAVHAQKSPSSPLEGEANVLVFPNLAAGNIGYKIAQRMGGALAIGPVLQGLARPANDLSRGCTSDDIFRMIAVTVIQARENEPS